MEGLDLIYAPPQLVYLAYWLTRQGPAEATLLKTAAQSRVDINPHQVEAALFALRGTARSSAFARGVLLADEVGLGKTIEAGLVLAQHWATHRRRLLLVVPASLRKQWQLELEEKFQLPTAVVDAQSLKASGSAVLQAPHVLIMSYEFAASRHRELAAISFDLVVFDEAHRLRSLHRDAKRATQLLEAFGQRQKILLTATPFQNSLVELWSLVHFLDQQYLGSCEAFEMQYRGRQLSAERLAELARRLKPICQRMLRRQVAADGHIKFTRRFALTLDFSPTPEEARLYEQVSAWLTNLDSVAFPTNGRHLVTLVIRKILASSSFAIEDTLTTVMQRLEQQERLTLEDLTPPSEQTLEQEVDLAATREKVRNLERLQAELVEIASYKKLAGSIERNAKGEALLTALTRAFASNEQIGGARKAVIFTESVRTQTYLRKLLEDHGYAGKVILLNGQNTDPPSRERLRQWKEKHAGTARISGSATADMKAAIVEGFRDEAEILIATESGAEGINLQFCQILVNYDLPWNPQRIEQRIGRVHRYGQQHDVIVVNLVNTQNQVDKLVHDILERKLKLFEGVFGASDEVLGAIEAGIDLERRIAEILEQRRTPEEIDAQFEQLREELDAAIQAIETQTREKVLSGFDVDVQRLLTDRRQHTAIGMSEHELHWLAFAEGALRATIVPSPATGGWSVHVGSDVYAADWSRAEKAGIGLIRGDATPFAEALAQWRRPCSPDVRLLLCAPDPQRLAFSDLYRLRGRRGALRCMQVEARTLDAGEYLLVAACTEDGRPIKQETARRLLLVPAVAVPLIGYTPAALDTLAEQAQRELLMQIDQQNQHWFDQENERLERWGDDQNAARELRVKQLDQQLKEARKAMRNGVDLAARVVLKREVMKLEAERDEAMMNYYSEKKRIGAEVEALVEKTLERLVVQPSIRILFTVEWELPP